MKLSVVDQLENFLFRDIPFTILQVIICYAMIVAFIQIYKFRNFKWTAFGLVTIMVFQGIFIYNKHDNKNDNFIIFNKSRYSMFGIKEKEKLNLFHNLDSAQLISNYAIKNYKVGESIDEIASDSLQFVYQYKNKIILAIDSLAIYKGVSFHPDYIVLRNSPRLNLNRVIDSLKPNLIIADGSNYKSYLKRWKATCAHKKIPYHQTNEKGAFIIE